MKKYALYRDLRYDSLTALSVVSLLMIIRNPYIIYNPSFQMSFLAALSIIFISSATTSSIPISDESTRIASSACFNGDISLLFQLNPAGVHDVVVLRDGKTLVFDDLKMTHIHTNEDGTQNGGTGINNHMIADVGMAFDALHGIAVFVHNLNGVAALLGRCGGLGGLGCGSGNSLRLGGFRSSFAAGTQRKGQAQRQCQGKDHFHISHIDFLQILTKVANSEHPGDLGIQSGKFLK